MRQGDPLSPFLFNLAAKYILDQLSPDIGYDLGGVHVGSLSFADDVVLIAASACGLGSQLRAFESAAGALGIRINAAKSVVLSLVPGKDKKIRVCTDLDFRVDGGRLTPLGVGDSFPYLGVRLDSSSIVTPGWAVEPMLERVRAAPLKVSQKLEIVRLHVIPSAIHPLVLGGVQLVN